MCEILLDANHAFGPHAQQLVASRNSILRCFDELKSENGAAVIANVAESLRDFVRAEKVRLEHRQFGVAQMEEHYFLPCRILLSRIRVTRQTCLPMLKVMWL